MYTNSWDPNNGQILISTDTGATFTSSSLPFKVGGNMPGRGMYVIYRISACFVSLMCLLYRGEVVAISFCRSTTLTLQWKSALSH